MIDWKHLEKYEKLTQKGWEQYAQQYRAIAEGYIQRLRYTDEGAIASDIENLTVIKEMQNKLRVLSEDFRAEIAADPLYIEAYEQGTPQPPPDTVLGHAAAEAAIMKALDFQYLVDVRMIIAESLNTAVQSITSLQGKALDDVYRMFNQSIRMGVKPIKLLRRIEALGVGENLAGVITRGTYMSTFRQYSRHVGNEIGAEYWRHSGPVPIQGDEGHELCQDHWREVYRKGEWEDIGEGYGISPVDLWDWVGGYGCRHTFDPVPAGYLDAIKKTKSDDDYYDELKNELDKYADIPDKKELRAELKEILGPIMK